MSTKKDKINSQHRYFMNLALLQAKRSVGNTSNNPAVGCLITDKRMTTISVGRTQFNGRPHAESDAIIKSKQKLNGSNIYITIEPCVHYGKTPPCTNKIIKNKINKVFFSLNDFDERSSGKAKKILKRNKIKVNESVQLKEINNFYSYYHKNKNKKLPYITSKLAVSRDGYICSKFSKYITNEKSRKVSHLLRSRNDGILITSKTLIKDNPLLNCRIPGLEKYNPIRVILDKNLNIPLNSRIVRSSNLVKTIIFYNKHDNKKINRLKRKKIRLIQVDLDNNQLPLIEIFKILYRLKISRLLIEGGKKLTNSLVNKSLIDEFFLFKNNLNIKKKGRLNVNSIIRKIKKKSKQQRMVTVNLNEDKLINYKLYV